MNDDIAGKREVADSDESWEASESLLSSKPLQLPKDRQLVNTIELPGNPKAGKPITIQLETTASFGCGYDIDQRGNVRAYSSNGVRLSNGWADVTIETFGIEYFCVAPMYLI